MPSSSTATTLFLQLILAALTLPPAARAAEITPPTQTGTQQRSDTVVKLAAAPRHRGVATLVPEIGIGGAAATADEYIFTAIGEVRPLSNGSIVIADRGSGSSVYVRLYDAQGKYIRTLGRYGQGPGEYSNPSGIGELPDGRVLVRDGRGNRIAVYNNAGEGSQLFSQSLAGTYAGTDMLLVSPDGTIHLRMSRPTLMAGTPLAPTVTGAYLRLRPDGSVIDTVNAPPSLSALPPMLSATSRSGNSISSTSARVPFTPFAGSLLSPLGYYVTWHTGRYAIDQRVPPAPPMAARGSAPPQFRDGDAVISIRRSVAAVAVNATESADRKRRIEDQMRGLEPAWQWTGPEIPKVKPPIASVRAGLDGRLWVQLSTPSERFDPAAEPGPGTPVASVSGGGAGGGGATGGVPAAAPSALPWREPVLFDVFDPDGTYIGQVSVPYNTSLSAMRGEYAWGIARDRDGVPTVHRFRIAWR